MLSLRDIQARFVAGLHGDANALDGVIAEGAFSAAERLNIYRNNYSVSFTEALAAVYPVVKRLVGDGFFRYLAARFLVGHPSRSGNIHEFGAELAAFVTDDPALAELPYLTDVARLEWSWHLALHAMDAGVASVEHIAAIEPSLHEQLRFQLHPSVSLHQSAYPIALIWEANQPDEDGAADLGAGGENVVVARVSGQVRVMRLPAADFAMLRAMADGATFADACAAAVRLDDEVDLAQALLAFLANELVTAIEAPGE